MQTETLNVFIILPILQWNEIIIQVPYNIKWYNVSEFVDNINRSAFFVYDLTGWLNLSLLSKVSPKKCILPWCSKSVGDEEFEVDMVWVKLWKSWREFCLHLKEVDSQLSNPCY